MTKLIKLVTFAAMMASWCVNADTWTDPATGIEWSYTATDGNASIGIDDNYITAVSRSTNGDLAIPSVINGLLVTGINSLAFLSCTGLASVTIPMSVTRIGDQAFSGCEKLKTAKIPSSVTSLSWGLFKGCGVLTQIVVDEDNPKVKFQNGVLLSRDGERLYEGVNGDIVIPAGVVIIEGCAFEGRKGLASVTMPSSVEIVGSEG